jgi:DNA-binding response OmpR family regulator
MRRLLLVEDDRSLGATLTDRLGREGYEVVWCATKRDAETKFPEQFWDLVILDLGLPDGSGFDVARRIRATSATPIVFLTAMNTAENRLEGFEMGAEEFIPKPFHLKELLLRVRHVLETHPPRRVIACGGKRIDLDAMAVVREDGTREFPASRDFRVLKLLIQSAPRAVHRDRILDQIWGEDRFPTQRTVDNAIVRLRQVLGDSEGACIRSVRGVGYQWAGPVESADE